MSRAYVALGDSYAAGVGAGRREPGPYRTDAGYPLAVARATGLDIAYQAVLGATCADVLRDQVGAVGAQTQLVTVTVGGNDAGFVPALISVARPGWAGSSDGAIDDALGVISGVLPGRLREVLRAVRGRARDARVVVTGYPHLFNGVSDCSWITSVSVHEMRRLGDAADRLAETILGVASDEGCEGVDVRAPFDGHQICDPDPWVHGLSWPTQESYHPTAAGHTAYARAVSALAVPAEGAVAAGVAAPQVELGACVGTAPTFALRDVMTGRAMRRPPL